MGMCEERLGAFQKKVRVVLVAANSRYLQFLLEQLCLDYVEVARIITADAPFSKNLSIQYGNQVYPLSPYEELPEILCALSYAYILVCGEEGHILGDMKRIGIPKEKIIDMEAWYTPLFLEKARLLRAVFRRKDLNDCRVLVTGISYAYFGTELSSYQLTTINAAGSSQGIYYDYQMAKHIFPRGGGLRYSVIGLAPYSFHFDLSKSSESWRVATYALALADVHNYHVGINTLSGIFYTGFQHALQQVENEEKIDFNDPVGSRLQNDYSLTAIQRLMARERAETWKIKRFPATVEENIDLLLSYLGLCRKRRIVPIVVVFPVSEIYRRYFSTQMLREFYNILHEIRKSNEIVLLDFFDSEEFHYDDFFDVDHLNRAGARKVSKKINDSIMRIEQRSGENN